MEQIYYIPALKDNRKLPRRLIVAVLKKKGIISKFKM